MKTLLKVSLCLCAFIFVAFIAEAQSGSKSLKKELKAKVEKDCKKEAKQLAKEGWKVMPGKLSIEKQIQEGRLAELSKDEEGSPLYLIATHQAKGGNYSAAQKIAYDRARQQLAGSISVNLTELIKNNVANTNLGNDDIELMNKVYDRILNTYKTIIVDDSPETGKISKRIAKRLLTRTHMLSIMPIVKRSLEENVSDEMFTNWVKNFFCGTKSVTKYSDYNTRCASGSGHAENVKVRLKIVKKDYENFMKQIQSGNTDDNSVNSVDVNVNDIDAEFSPVVTTEPINNSDDVNVDADVDSTDKTNETETNVEASETLSETTAA